MARAFHHTVIFAMIVRLADGQVSMLQGDSWRNQAPATATVQAAAQASVKEYSTNAICRQYNCINPIFPGMEDLRLMEATPLQTQSSQNVKQYSKFCKNLLYYDVAVPSPKSGKNVTYLSSVVAAQDHAAATMYYYHLAGLNVEGWEHRHPWNSQNDCTQAIWKMVCNTYFPRAEAGSKPGEPTKLLKPCKNVCGSYIEACGVECCDESVQCVFTKEVSLLNGSSVTTSGYYDDSGPSAYCTGGSSRSQPGVLVALLGIFAIAQQLLPGFANPTTHIRSSSRVSEPGQQRKPKLSAFWGAIKRSSLVMMLIVVSTTLQGCMLSTAFSHPTPSWMDVPSYWLTFQYIPQGEPASQAIENSCELALPKKEQCSGHGECREFRADLKLVNGAPTMFCQCFRDWADPECRTQRKSQATAYFLSIFFGYFGFDHFYLGWYYSGFAKLATLGGAGFWYVYDVVYIGSSPVYTRDYRVAYDLAHWLFVSFTVLFFSVLGYFIFGLFAVAVQREKKNKKLLMQAEEEYHQSHSAAAHINPQDTIGIPTFRSYGMPLPTQPSRQEPLPGNYGTWDVPPQVASSGRGNPYSPYAVWNHAMQGYRQKGSQGWAA
jgi:hypothetical protein